MVIITQRLPEYTRVEL